MKTGFLPVIFVTIAVLASGCAGQTMAQRESNAISSGIASAFSAFSACVDSIHRKPEYVPLLPKIGGDVPTIEQLNDLSFPTEEEKALLAQRFTEKEGCYRASISTLSANAPSLAAVIADSHDAARIFLADFLKGGTTWGDYNRLLDRLWHAMETDWRAAIDRINQELHSAHDYEVARRGAGYGAAVGAIGAAMIGYSASRPRGNNVTCMPLGSGFTCNQW